jgi:hypothetical protein
LSQNLVRQSDVAHLGSVTFNAGMMQSAPTWLSERKRNRLRAARRVASKRAALRKLAVPAAEFSRARRC